MATERHVRVRERAYEIWVQSGQPEGRSDEHWLQAEQDLAASEAEPKAPSRKATGSKSVASKASPAKPKTAAAKAPAGKAATARAPVRRSQAKSAEASPTKH